jgi:hypothetical protein
MWTLMAMKMTTIMMTKTKTTKTTKTTMNSQILQHQHVDLPQDNWLGRKESENNH